MSAKKIGLLSSRMKFKYMKKSMLPPPSNQVPLRERELVWDDQKQFKASSTLDTLRWMKRGVYDDMTFNLSTNEAALDMKCTLTLSPTAPTSCACAGQYPERQQPGHAERAWRSEGRC